MGLLYRAVGAKTEDVAESMGGNLSVEQELPSPSSVACWRDNETFDTLLWMKT